MRANLARSAKEHDRKVFALQKLHAEEAARQRDELDKAVQAKESIFTENAFLKRDLQDQGQKVRELNRSIKAGESSVGRAPLTRGASAGSGASTPRKSKGLPYRDGFDDDEIVPSPTRASGGRPKAPTPRTGGKRKRAAFDDSPMPALELSQPRRESSGDSAAAQQPASAVDEAWLRRAEQADGRSEVSAAAFVTGRI